MIDAGPQEDGTAMPGSEPTYSGRRDRQRFRCLGVITLCHEDRAETALAKAWAVRKNAEDFERQPNYAATL